MYPQKPPPDMTDSCVAVMNSTGQPITRADRLVSSLYEHAVSSPVSK